MLGSLSDSEVFDKLKAMVFEERRISGEVLTLLREVSRRRLYARYGYESLFSFLVKELGYDEASAYRRVSAIRVMQAVPEVEAALEQGMLSIATIAQAQTFFQQEAKRGAKPVSVEKKREILKRLEGCSKREAERVLGMESPGAAKPDQVRAITEAQTEIRFTADQELMDLLKKLQGLIAHRELELELGYNGLFKFLAKEALKKLDPAKKPKPAACRADLPKAPENKPRELSPVKVAVRSRYIPRPVRQAVWKRDEGKCTYVSPDTGRRCESRHALEFEHAKPFALGGATSEGNLTLHCRTHNREKAVAAFGECAWKTKWE